MKMSRSNNKTAALHGDFSYSTGLTAIKNPNKNALFTLSATVLSGCGQNETGEHRSSSNKLPFFYTFVS